MLVTFTTETYANITLFKDIALQLLKMMGHSPVVPGVIMAEDVPAALQHLRLAIDAERVSLATADDDEDGPRVSLKNRALPLLELLSTASSCDANVMWDWR